MCPARLLDFLALPRCGGLKKIPPWAVWGWYTSTFDNGTEFAAAEELERSCINKHLPRTKVYFCHPYSSWERGTNENTNGMIRRRFPKGTNFAAVTNAQITQAENWINNYPRKILGYKSSEIVFRECLRELGIAA